MSARAASASTNCREDLDNFAETATDEARCTGSAGPLPLEEEDAAVDADVDVVDVGDGVEGETTIPGAMKLVSLC